MGIMLDGVSWLLLVTGSVFCVIGGIGLLRMPDFYTRCHAASLTDTLGATLILLGLALQSGLGLVTVKLLFVLFFVYLTSPTATHALVKAAYSHGVVAASGEDEQAPGVAGEGAG